LTSNDHIFLTGLKVPCIIGIFGWERKRKQSVVIDLKFPCDIRRASRRDFINDTVDYKKIAKFTIAFVEKSKFKLVETLAEKLAGLLLENFSLSEIDVAISKPGAIRGSQNVGIRINRISNKMRFKENIFFSLGSNISPKQNLENALYEIQKKYSIKGLSHTYETSPVGRIKQASFWNLVIAVEGEERPKAIRTWIKTLEKKAGRRHSSNAFGPRTLDVDLLLWGNHIEKNKYFSLPHPDITTKAFVLFPLLEIAPNLIHPAFKKTIIELAVQFRDRKQEIHQLPANIFREFFPRKL
jgi:2-amino-4-hydroxy-6-hydroxymethyldihydropteridine diphosphokinase